MPVLIHLKGSFEIISWSGTLTKKAVNQTNNVGLGQTTFVGIGGDPFNWTNFIDVLKRLMDDYETKGIIMIGEIGSVALEKATDWIIHNNPKTNQLFHLLLDYLVHQQEEWVMQKLLSRLVKDEQRTRYKH